MIYIKITKLRCNCLIKMKKRETRYKVHVFVCTREKENSKACAEGDAVAVKDRLKSVSEERGWKPSVRISESGCLGVCGAGPNVMIYPQKIWYTGVKLEDIEEIITDIEDLLSN